MADKQTLDTIIAEAMPIMRAFGTGRWAVAIGGSIGKGQMDPRSDVDFRFYADELFPFSGESFTRNWAALEALMARWREKGVEIDGVWPRSVPAIDAALDEWLAGKGKTDPIVWTVWGYHLPTDIYNQLIIEDPYGIAQGWKQRMTPYPSAMRDGIVKEHAASLKYWRTDYHYASKVARNDVVFLSSLTARLVHDIMEILFAINGIYYSGDGMNLTFARKFPICPENLDERVTAILYPGRGEGVLAGQYAQLKQLIDEVLALTEA